MSATSENNFVTSKDDLLRILSKCSKCHHSIQNGELIISYDQLESINLTDFKNKKIINIIINSSKNNTEIGHWANLVIFNKKVLFFLDGLNQIKTNDDIMNSIHDFATNNKLQLHHFNVRYQVKSSKKCGLLACFVVQKSAHSSISPFFNFRRLLIHNSIATNEKLMLDSVKKHFKIMF